MDLNDLARENERRMGLAQGRRGRCIGRETEGYAPIYRDEK